MTIEEDQERKDKTHEITELFRKFYSYEIFALDEVDEKTQ